MVDDIEDPRRRDPTGVAPEREMLEEWLEFHRTTLLLKCEGVHEADLKHRPIATSNLSLHGLVRHMAEVERNWFQRVLQGNDAPFIWVDPQVDDASSSRSVRRCGQRISPRGRQSVSTVAVPRRPTAWMTRASGVASRTRCAGSTCT
jgi:uncharacterized damage-inducible protein DinB